MSRFQSAHEHLPAESFAKPSYLLGVAFWAIASIGGFWSLLSYSTTPGAASPVQSVWPQESRIVPDRMRANLVLLAHPRCPCSRASITQLGEILTRCEGLVCAHVLFLKPAQSSDGWEQRDLWVQAQSIPGVRVISDDEGAEARRFGAQTSGQVVLFDHNGFVRFRGGITIARGHNGENMGRQAIVDWLTRGISDHSSAPVFGCRLFSDRDIDAEGRR